MTAERFQWVFIKDNELELRDNGIVKRFNNERLEELLNKLHSRNKRLEEKIQRERTSFMKTHERWSKEAENKIKELAEKNEQLQARNDRQAKQLDRLYRLIEEKDWRTLSDILDDFKRCEEQLQRESGIYW